MGRQKQDPALYRVVETVRAPDGRLVRTGHVWQPDLDRTRRFGRVLAANSVAHKVQVADESGYVIETIPPPPPGSPVPGWGDWMAQMAQQPPLPPLPPPPPRPPAKRRAAPGPGALAAPPTPPAPAPQPPAAAAASPAAPPAAPPAVPELPAESEVERTATIPPGTL